MSAPPEFEIVALDRIEAQLRDWRWPFVETEKEAIARHWQDLTVKTPALFNGKVLLQCESFLEIDPDGRTVLRAAYFETDYAAFVAQRTFKPRDGVRNGFAMAALRSADGAFLLGLMSARTFNAGKIYFPAGTPDRSDLTPDGSVDLAGSVLRELEEETGLIPDEVEIGTGWTAVFAADLIAFMRPVLIDLPAEAARQVIRARLAQQTAPELADIIVVRGPADAEDERMPPYMRAYLRWALPES